jgi:hypothetical protein
MLVILRLAGLEHKDNIRIFYSLSSLVVISVRDARILRTGMQFTPHAFSIMANQHILSLAQS